jgi:non-homologous end joining protein Ku
LEGVNMNIAVEIYKMIKIATKPTHTWLYSRTNEPLQVISKYFDSNTGAVLDVQNQISTYIDVGGTKVPMVKDDMNSLKSSVSSLKDAGGDNVGITLLYFIPQDQLPKELNLDEPYFIFPDEKTIKGVFAVHLQYLSKFNFIFERLNNIIRRFTSRFDFKTVVSSSKVYLFDLILFLLLLLLF